MNYSIKVHVSDPLSYPPHQVVEFEANSMIKVMDTIEQMNKFGVFQSHSPSFVIYPIHSVQRIVVEEVA
jgi:hypothetical protein